MKILDVDTNENGGDGYIVFQFQEHVYYIGEIENNEFHWFLRQTIQDYLNGRDNWQSISWEDAPDSFKFFKFFDK